MTVLFLDGAFGVILIGFLLFCLLDVITTDPADIRNLPKIAWVFLVFINPVGGIAWLIAGRPQRAASATGPASPVRPAASSRGRLPQGPRRSIAPDDDPEFLAGLGRAASDRERMLGSWEEDLRRREEELRRRRGDEDERDG